MQYVNRLTTLALVGAALFGSAARAVAQDTTTAVPAAAPAEAEAQAQADTRPTVAVMYFNNGAIGKAHEELEPLRKGLADMLITEFAGNTAVRVIERDNLEALLKEQDLSKADRVDKETAVRIGKLLGVHHMIFGGFVTDGRETMRLDIRAVEVETGRIEYVETVTDKKDNLFQMISRIAGKANAGMKLPAMPPAVREASTQKAKKLPFRAALLYSRALAAKDQGDTAQAAELFSAVLTDFPEYEPAKKEQAKLRLAGGN